LRFTITEPRIPEVESRRYLTHQAMPAELVLAGLETAKTGTQILVYIIRTVQNVRRLKKECEKVGELAQLLQNILDSNKEALKSSSTEKKLQAHLRDVATFVANCTKDYSLLGRAWEVMWDQKLPKLLAGLKDWILYFLMDTMVSFSQHHDDSP